MMCNSDLFCVPRGQECVNCLVVRTSSMKYNYVQIPDHLTDRIIYSVFHRS